MVEVGRLRLVRHDGIRALGLGMALVDAKSYHVIKEYYCESII
jgi:hypothetical protein